MPLSVALSPKPNSVITPLVIRDLERHCQNSFVRLRGLHRLGIYVHSEDNHENKGMLPLAMGICRTQSFSHCT